VIDRFRICKACKEEKPIEKFATMGKKKWYLRRRTCSKCLNAKYKDYHKKYRKDHYEKKPPRFKWATATEEQKIVRIKELFESVVIKKEEECWGWKRKLHKTGYTMIRYNKLQTSGHRVSWFIHNGEIPEGLIVCHKCDNKICTNPEHLFLGTHSDNTKDMLSKGRNTLTKKNHGQSCKWSKLTNIKVKQIKKLLTLGVTVARISRDFKVSYMTIKAIKDGRNWKHVNI